MLKVRLTGFHLDDVTNSTELLGFSIDKTVSDTLNPYIQETDSSCILDRNIDEKDKAGIIRFILDFKSGFLSVKCSNSLKSITILEKEREKATGGALSDEGLFRPKRNLKEQNVDTMFDDDIVKHYMKEEEEKSVEATTVKTSSSARMLKADADKVPPVVSS